MGAAFLSFWSVLGGALFSLRHPFAMEVFFHCKGEENSLESGSIVYILSDLKG